MDQRIKHQNPEAGTRQVTGIRSRFGSAVHILADKYAHYKYNHTDWRTNGS